MADALDEMIPDYSVAEYVGGGGAEQYKTVGRLLAGWFREYGGLQPNENVLEVGCGIGRVAIHLTQYLEGGTYDGFDIVRHGIEWCQKRVTPRYPNFRFFHADIHNQAYNPGGRQRASEYRFPYPGGSFDFAYLTSVFTHMLPRDIEHYIAEIGRVLRPGGRCFCTAYVISADAKAQIAAGTSRKQFAPQPAGHWTDTPENPEAATAYPEDYLLARFAAAGLEPARFVPGEWWKNEFAQDIVVLRKRA